MKDAPTEDPGAVAEYLGKTWPEGFPSGHVLPCVAMKGAFNDAGKWVVGVEAIEFCQTTADAVAWLISKDSTGHDVYLQLSTIRKERAESLRASKQRGGSNDVAAVTGFYLDIDVGPGKFPSIEVAVWFASTVLPIRPTLLVGSGGGVHAVYLFREVEYIDNPVQMQAMQAKIHGFSLLAKNAAQKSGFRMDSVWDLSRIGRIPGTWNKKGGQLREVKLLAAEGQRINPSDLEDYAVEVSKATRGQDSALESMGAVCVDANNAGVNQKKFDALCELEPKFRSSWNHRRRDLQDVSNSGYDMSLATFAAMAGWSPQEIINLLVAHRTKWADSAAESQQRDPVRLKRPQYYIDTVARAFASVKDAERREREGTGAGLTSAALRSDVADVPEDTAPRAAAVNDTAPLADDASSGSEDPDEERQLALDFFYDQLRIRIRSVVVYGDDTNVFLVNDKIRFHGDGDFQSWQKWRVVAIAGGYVPNVKKPRQWELALASLYKVVVSREKGSGDVEALGEFLKSLWERAVKEQAVNTGQGEEIVRRRTFSISEWGWYRDGDEIVIDPNRFADQYRQSSALYPFRATKMFRLALDTLKARKVMVAVTGSTKRCLAVTILREEN